MYYDLKEGAREAVCIAIQTGRAAGASRRARGRGTQGGARGTQAGIWARGARGPSAGAHGGRGKGALQGSTAGARGTGSRHGRWAFGLGVLLGCGLCTWCTQPVFDPV